MGNWWTKFVPRTIVFRYLRCLHNFAKRKNEYIEHAQGTCVLTVIPVVQRKNPQSLKPIKSFSSIFFLAFPLQAYGAQIVLGN
jgi:hypothetical protein